jgi:hypothetical protein
LGQLGLLVLATPQLKAQRLAQPLKELRYCVQNALKPQEGARRPQRLQALVQVTPQSELANSMKKTLELSLNAAAKPKRWLLAA